MGIALLRLGRWEEAAPILQRAIDLHSGAPEPHVNFGIALLKMARWEEAVAACRRSIALHPQTVALHEKLGLALSKLDRWQDAALAYQQAVVLDPADPALHSSLGNALLKLEQWNDAATSFRQALSRLPDDAGASAGLNTALAKLSGDGETGAGQEIADAVGHLRVGLSFATLERWEEATKALREGMSGFHFLLVDPLVRLGRLKEAAAAFRQATELGSSRPHLPSDNTAVRFGRRRDVFWTPANLGPDVFRISEWLEGAASGPVQRDPAATGTEPRAPDAKLLFVLDNDYGELTTIMYLLLGRPLINNSRVLLPPRLYPSNVDVLPGRIGAYATVEDVIQVVDREHPDIVFLCSGYLLTVHEILSPDDLQRLVRLLRERGCRVVTTDPFLGLFCTQDPRALVSIQIPEAPDNPHLEVLQRTKEVQDERLWTHFSHCAETFRETTHLYPAYRESGEGSGTNSRSVAFSNPVLTTAPVPRHETPSVRGGSPVPPHWLFVLSQTDYEAQVMFDTPAGFTDIVASRVVDALAAGRHPIVVAPKEFITRLTDRMPTAEGVDLLYHCPFRQLLPVLLSAEYVFYWNVLSHTILIRLFNRLPTVVFDKGHLIRNVPTLYDRIVQWYYQGWTPPLRDHREPLTLATVSAYAESYRNEAQRISEGFAQAATPEQMIQSLMTTDAAAAR